MKKTSIKSFMIPLLLSLVALPMMSESGFALCIFNHLQCKAALQKVQTGTMTCKKAMNICLDCMSKCEIQEGIGFNYKDCDFALMMLRVNCYPQKIS